MLLCSLCIAFTSVQTKDVDDIPRGLFIDRVSNSIQWVVLPKSRHFCVLPCWQLFESWFLFSSELTLEYLCFGSSSHCVIWFLLLWCLLLTICQLILHLLVRLTHAVHEILVLRKVIILWSLGVDFTRLFSWLLQCYLLLTFLRLWLVRRLLFNNSSCVLVEGWVVAVTLLVQNPWWHLILAHDLRTRQVLIVTRTFRGWILPILLLLVTNTIVLSHTLPEVSVRHWLLNFQELMWAVQLTRIDHHCCLAVSFVIGDDATLV